MRLAVLSNCVAAALLGTLYGLPAPAAGPPAPPADRAGLAARASAILKANCYRCHGQDGTVEGGLNYILDFKALVARNKVVPGDPKKSRLFQRVSKGEMPPEDETKRPIEEEIAKIKKWIEDGAVDHSPTAVKRQFIS